MTERTLPAPSTRWNLGTTPAAPRPVGTPPGAPAPTQAAPRRSALASLAKRREDPLFSTMTRTGVLVGVSAAVYAVSLAAVSGLEAQTRAQDAAAVQPVLDAVAATKTSNDQLESTVKAGDARVAALVKQYDATRAEMTAYAAQLQQLSALVAKVEGSAAAISANFKLPTITARGAVGGGGGSVVTTTTASGKKP